MMAWRLTSAVTSLMKGKMALTLVAEEANCKHSLRKPCLDGWALRYSLLQMKTKSLKEVKSVQPSRAKSTLTSCNTINFYRSQDCLIEQEVESIRVFPRFLFCVPIGC